MTKHWSTGVLVRSRSRLPSLLCMMLACGARCHPGPQCRLTGWDSQFTREAQPQAGTASRHDAKDDSTRPQERRRDSGNMALEAGELSAGGMVVGSKPHSSSLHGQAHREATDAAADDAPPQVCTGVPPAASVLRAWFSDETCCDMQPKVHIGMCHLSDACAVLVQAEASKRPKARYRSRSRSRQRR